MLTGGLFVFILELVMVKVNVSWFDTTVPYSYLIYIIIWVIWSVRGIE